MLGHFSRSARRGGNAVHARHDHVHEHDIRLHALADADALLTRARLTDQLQVMHDPQERRESTPHDLVVVHDHDPDASVVCIYLSACHVAMKSTQTRIARLDWPPGQARDSQTVQSAIH